LTEFLPSLGTYSMAFTIVKIYFQESGKIIN
jgi:uncharacterized membrane protein